MDKILIISPFSQKLRNFQQNPKNFPHWQEVISKIKQNKIVDTIWQLGVKNEYRFEGAEHKFDLPLNEIEKLAKKCSVWASVDNFFPHLCNAINLETKGVVVFGKSNPKHFGYPQNINLFKDVKYFRPDQFLIWEFCDYDENAFVSSDEVVNAISNILEPKIEYVLSGTTN